MYTIEKGIPIQGVPRTKYPWADMEPGDSVFFDGVTPAIGTVRQSVYKFAKATGWPFTVRPVLGGFRVWRVKQMALDLPEAQTAPTAADPDAQAAG